MPRLYAVHQLAQQAANIFTVLPRDYTVRCYAERGCEIACRLSVRPSVRPWRWGMIFSHSLEYFENNFMAK